MQPRLPAMAFRVGGLLTEIDQHATVGSPARRLDEEGLGQKPFTTPVWAHYTDIELRRIELREGNQIAARRPHRRSISARAEADAVDVAAIGVHHVKLLRAAAIG